jgi:hypothetical protein
MSLGETAWPIAAPNEGRAARQEATLNNFERMLEGQNYAVFVSEKFALLFRREGGDDFLEARITTERVPFRV